MCVCMYVYIYSYFLTPLSLNFLYLFTIYIFLLHFIYLIACSFWFFFILLPLHPLKYMVASRCRDLREDVQDIRSDYVNGTLLALSLLMIFGGRLPSAVLFMMIAEFRNVSRAKYWNCNYSMVQDLSWKAESRLLGQVISRRLWEPKFQYHIHKIGPLKSRLRQLNRILYFGNIYFNIILTSNIKHAKWFCLNSFSD
jgi:hypothetical protein